MIVPLKNFTNTSTKPYDRNWYKVHCKDKSVKILQSYEEVLECWWNYNQLIDKVEVIDAKRTKQSGIGF